jgi:uncharacterized phage-associated protein
MPTRQQIEKLGNTLVFLAENVSELNKTKALKLLFLLEEKSIRERGYPFFGFKFEIWQYGPVLKEVYVDLENDLPLLNNYIQRTPYDPSIFEAKARFVDDEFSDWDLELLEQIKMFAKNKIAKDLVEITQAPDSLWVKSAKQNKILQDLLAKKITTTDFTIDFSLLFEDGSPLKERYLNSVENLQLIESLKD